MFFKRKCKHTKDAGEPLPDNMVTALCFTPYKNERLEFASYKVLECNKCGVRSFLGMRHLMRDGITEPIDEFISRKVRFKDIEEQLRKYGVKFKVYHNRIKEKQ